MGYVGRCFSEARGLQAYRAPDLRPALGLWAPTVKGGKFSNGQLLLPLFNVKQGVVLGDILCKDMLC